MLCVRVCANTVCWKSNRNGRGTHNNRINSFFITTGKIGTHTNKPSRTKKKEGKGKERGEMDGSKKKGEKWKRDKAQIVHLVFCCPSPLHSLHIHSNTRLFSGRCAGNQNNKPADTLGRRRDAKQILKKDGKKKRGRCKIEIIGGKKREVKLQRQ